MKWSSHIGKTYYSGLLTTIFCASCARQHHHQKHSHLTFQPFPLLKNIFEKQRIQRTKPLSIATMNGETSVTDRSMCSEIECTNPCTRLKNSWIPMCDDCFVQGGYLNYPDDHQEQKSKERFPEMHRGLKKCPCRRCHHSQLIIVYGTHSNTTFSFYNSLLFLFPSFETSCSIYHSILISFFHSYNFHR